MPAQILCVTDAVGSHSPLHLDSAATCLYITLSEAHRRGFNIYPNNQSSQLGERVTIIKWCHEIDVPI